MPPAPLPEPQDVVARRPGRDANIALHADADRAARRRRSTSGRRSSPARCGRSPAAPLGAEIGALLGYMGRRVLGQYEVALSTGDRRTPAAAAAPRRRRTCARARVAARGAARGPARVGHRARGHARRAVLRRSRGCRTTSAVSSASCSPVRRRVARRRPREHAGRSPTCAPSWRRARDGGLVTLVGGAERARPARPHPVHDGARRGSRRARDGRRGRPARPRPAAAARGSSSAAAPSARRWRRSSTGSWGSR